MIRKIDNNSYIPITALILHVLYIAWNRRFILLFAIVGSVCLSIVAYTFKKEAYKVHTTVLIQEPDKINPFLQDVAIATHLKERINALEALLHSHNILQNVLADLKGKGHQVDDSVYGMKILSARLSLKLTGKELVTITLKGSEKTLMKDTLERVSHYFIESVLAPARSSITKSYEFLTKEKDKALQKLKKSEEELAQFKNQYSKMLPHLHMANLNHFRSLQRGGAVSSGDMLLLPQNRLDQKIIDVMAELTAARSRYTQQHSRIIVLEKHLKALENERKRLSSDNEDNPAVQHQSNSITQAEEQAMNDADLIQQAIDNYGDIEKQFNRIQQQVAQDKGYYDSILERHNKAKFTQNLGKYDIDSRVKIIDAVGEPVSTSVLNIYAYIVIGFIIGFIVGATVCFFVELFSPIIYHTYQLNTNLPVYLVKI